MNRVFDIFFSLIGLIVLSPFLITFSILIWLNDFHSPLYIAKRVGKKKKFFKMIKLRTMIKDADKNKVDSTSSDDKNLIDSFMKISENLKDAGESEFDYEANPGDAIIFSEGGIHRGSTPTKNDRLVLRYFYKPQKQSYTVFE